MVRKIVVLINWTSLSALDFVVFMTNVVLKLTGNLTFPDLPVSLVVAQAAIDRLNASYPLRKNGAKEKQEYEDAEAALDEIAHQYAEYVNFIAKGVAATIIAGGFVPSSGITNPAVVPDGTGPVSLKPAMGGLLHLSVGTVTGADSYVYVIYLAPGGAAITVIGKCLIIDPNVVKTIIITDGNKRETIQGLTPGMHVFVQALAQNSAGKSPLSPMMDCFII